MPAKQAKKMSARKSAGRTRASAKKSAKPARRKVTKKKAARSPARKSGGRPKATAKKAAKRARTRATKKKPAKATVRKSAGRAKAAAKKSAKRARPKAVQRRASKRERVTSREQQGRLSVPRPRKQNMGLDELRSRVFSELASLSEVGRTGSRNYKLFLLIKRSQKGPLNYKLVVERSD